MAWPRSLRAAALMLLVAACGDPQPPTVTAANNNEDRTVARALNAPGFVTGAQDETGAAAFAWVDSNIDEDGYLLQRRLPDTSAWALISSYGPDTTTGADSEITERATYFYRVVSFRGAQTAPTAALRLTFADETPPNTLILFHPPERTDDRSATFLFRSSEGAATFACEVDGDEFPCDTEVSCLTGSGTCQGVVRLGGLADGDHTFSVIAADPASNADPTPATFAWEVDTAAPTVTFDQVPDELGNDTAYRFEFSSSDARADTFCRLGAEAFAACESPVSGDLGPTPAENNTFEVKAVDELGNEALASHTWYVDVVGPAITFLGTPAALTPALPAGGAFRVQVADALSTLDDSRPVMCAWSSTAGGAGWNGAATLCAAVNGTHNLTSPATVGSGRYTLTVTARDRWGNSRSAAWSWDVDEVAPVIAFTRTPPATSGNALFYRFAADEDIASYYCDLDGDAAPAPVACDHVHEFVGLAPGSYQAQITATDHAGNVAPMITHNVDVTYAAWGTDVCAAGGDVFFIDDFPRAQGRDDDRTQIGAQPIIDYLWRELIAGIQLIFSYRLTWVDEDGPPSTVWLWGPSNNSWPTGITEALAGPGEPLCVNDRPSSNVYLTSVGKKSGRWVYEAGWYDSDSRADDQPVATDRLSFAGAAYSRLILRHRHPQRGWLIEPGVDWQVQALVDVSHPTIRPDSLTVVATAPENDELSRQSVDFADVHTAGDAPEHGRLEVTVEPPFCAGMMRLAVTAVPGDGNMSDVMQLPLLASAADDRYEPNDDATEALAGASFAAPVTVPNLRLLDDDWLHFSVDSNDDVNVRVRAIGGDVTTPVWATLWEDDGTMTAIASGSGGDVVLAGTGIDAANDYFVEITAASVPDCLRVRVEISP